MTGPCAKAVVRCTLITPDGERFVGENWCETPQAVCPRVPGEDYAKCRTICRQVGHAEQVAMILAGEKAVGARAYLEGHTYACMECQHAMFAAGVASFTVGKPPDDEIRVRAAAPKLLETLDGIKQALIHHRHWDATMAVHLVGVIDAVLAEAAGGKA